MTNKILKAILSAAVVVLLASLTVITGVMYQYFGTAQENQLKEELSLAASATEQLGEDYLNGLDYNRYRITWIQNDGTVLFDSHADAASMENHADRVEFQEALKLGYGSSTRHSDTLTEETIYEATRLDDGSILRISVSRATALALLRDMVQPIVVILMIAIVLSYYLARRMAKRIVEPFNTLNLNQPMENTVYEELSPLLYRIHAQQTEIKSRMDELKHKQDEFNQITNHMKEALILLDQSGKIISINPAAKQLFQVQDDCIGEDFLAINRQQTMRVAVQNASIQGHAGFRDQKNSRVYQFDLSRIDSQEKHYGMVILAFDITEQINAEKHRQEFTANVSHELKTPLQSIIGSAELMENGIVKSEDIPSFVGRIRKEATRLVDLIDDIIRLSQLDEGTELPREDVSLRALAEEVCETLSDSAKMKNVSMEVTGVDAKLYGVRRLLYEVVYNLCDNAIRYNRPNGSVTIDIEQTKHNICLRVQDTGIGIAPEHQGKVFERFYRVDQSHSKQSGGTGLGLSIVKRAVQYHHGTVALESTWANGTIISILFDRTMNHIE